MQRTAAEMREITPVAMNGSKGRARTLAAIKREIKRDAAAAGVDVTDPHAVMAWHEARMREIYAHIIRNSGKPVEQWT